MNLPIEIRRKDYNGNDFSITATTNYTCNYNCSYCYNTTHNCNLFLDLTLLNKFIQKIVLDTKKTIDLFLIGGESTLHQNLLSFAYQFNIQKYGGMSIFTNLSANIELYKKLMDQNVTIIATYHTFGNNADEFINKAICLKQYMISDLLKINVMFEKKFINNSLYVYDKLKPHIEQIELCLEHHQVYLDTEIIEFEQRHKTEKYNVDPYVITFSDKSTKELYYNDLANSHFFDVKKWLCNAGYDSFYINVNGDLYQCESHFFDKKKCIGNIKYICNTNITYKKTICMCSDCYNFHIYKKKIFV